MMRKIKRWPKALAVLAFAAVLFSCPMTAFAGWQKEGDTYAYYEDNGTRVVNSFKKSGSQWFYLDENGYILKNCEREINGKIYVFNERGAMDPNATRDAGTEADEITAQNQWTKDQYGTGTEFIAISGRQQYLNKTANPYMNNNTVQWMNATYAILTRHNTANIRAFGGGLKLAGKEEGGAAADQTTKDNNRQMLKKSWNVTDRASAENVLEKLLSSARSDHSAWDYSRAMSNIGFYYLADYYGEREALDKALEVAKEIQDKFSSWDDFVEGYLEGYEEWSGDDSGERRDLYENLRDSQWNPYGLDWNMKLKKSW